MSGDKQKGNTLEDAFAEVIEPVVDKVVALHKKLEEIKLTPGPKGDPGKDAETVTAVDVANALFEEHGAELRGEVGATPEPTLVAEVLYGKFKDELKGEPGESVRLEDVIEGAVKALVEFHADTLRGEKGQDGETPDVDTIVDRLVQTHSEELKGADGLTVPVEDVVKYLIENHSEDLRGEKGQEPAVGEIAEFLVNEYKDQLQGAPGKEASIDYLTLALTLVENHGDSLQGPAGQDSTVTVKEVADFLLAEHVDVLRGAPGADASVDYITLALTLVENHLDTLRGPEGPTPEINTEDVVKDLAVSLASNDSFLASLKGDKGDAGKDGEDGAPGKDGDPGKDGEDGEKGKDGEDGVDRFILTPVQDDPDARLEKNDLIYHSGGLWQAVKKTIGNPEKDPGSYRLVCNGVTEVSHVLDKNERQHTISCRLSDGGQFNLSWADPPSIRVDGDGYTPIAKDIRVEGSMLEVYNGVTNKWVPTVSLKGEPGKEGGRGRKGMRGESGVGVKSFDFDDGLFHVKMTGPVAVPASVDQVAIAPNLTLLIGPRDEKGDATDFFLSLTEPPKEEVPEQIRRFAGNYRKGAKYLSGDVVASVNGLHLSLKDGGGALGGRQWLHILKLPNPAPTQPVASQRFERERWDGKGPREPSMQPVPELVVAKAGSLWFCEFGEDSATLQWVEEKLS